VASSVLRGTLRYDPTGEATDWIQNSSTLHVSITWLRHGRATAGVQRTQLVPRLLTDSSTGKEKRKQEGVERFTKKD
jgi:hypothetical protein